MEPSKHANDWRREWTNRHECCIRWDIHFRVTTEINVTTPIPGLLICVNTPIYSRFLFRYTFQNVLTCLFIVIADRIIDTSECGVTFVAYYLLMGCYLCKRNDIETAVFIMQF